MKPKVEAPNKNCVQSASCRSNKRITLGIQIVRLRVVDLRMNGPLHPSLLALCTKVRNRFQRRRVVQCPAHQDLISKDRWVIDGYGSWSSVKSRLDVADTILFIDHHISVHYWWATKRQIKSLLWGRPDGPEGCPMFPATLRLYKMMWWVHREMRPKLLDAIEAQRRRARIIHIRSPEELASFASNPV